MKTDIEMTADILNEVQRRTRQRRRRASVLAAALVIVLTATAVFATQKAGLLPPRESGARSATDKSQTNEAVSQESGKEPTEPFATSRADAQTTNGIAAPTTDKAASTNAAPHGTETTTQRITAPSTTANCTTANLTTAQRPATTGDPTTTQGASEPDKSGGEIDTDIIMGGPMIPALPFDRSIRETGEAITDEEAAAYFRENAWLSSALTASGVDAEGIRVAEHGYCHISYDGTEGKSFEVRRNFRDYLVWNGSGDLIAIVTLTKENGTLSATPAFGGPWFRDYNAFLRQHRGEALVYVYAGWMELVITPDNEVVSPQGTDVSRYLRGIENPYEIFRCDAATYVP